MFSKTVENSKVSFRFTNPTYRGDNCRFHYQTVLSKILTGAAFSKLIHMIVWRKKTKRGSLIWDHPPCLRLSESNVSWILVWSDNVKTTESEAIQHLSNRNDRNQKMKWNDWLIYKWGTVTVLLGRQEQEWNWTLRNQMSSLWFVIWFY